MQKQKSTIKLRFCLLSLRSAIQAPAQRSQSITDSKETRIAVSSILNTSQQKDEDDYYNANKAPGPDSGDDDDDELSDLELTPTTPKLAFHRHWLKDPSLKVWLLERHGLAYCRFCCVTVAGGITHMHRHKKRTRHQELYNKNCTQSDVEEALRTTTAECDDSKSPSKQNSIKYAFKPRWLLRPELKDWIIEKNNRSFCLYCEIPVLGGLNDLYRHGKTTKHMYNAIVKKKAANPLLSLKSKIQK